MFERFTNRARQVVVEAQNEARHLHHHHIGTEHLLLALLSSDGGLAQTVLRDAGLDRDRCRAGAARLYQAARGELSASDAAALRAIGIDLDAVRAKIEESFGPGALQPPCEPRRRRGLLGRRRRAQHVTLGYIPFTPRAKKVLELALREALVLNHRYIGTEHILLGLVREGQGLAAKVITDAGVDLADLRDRTIAALKRAA